MGMNTEPFNGTLVAKHKDNRRMALVSLNQSCMKPSAFSLFSNPPWSRYGAFYCRALLKQTPETDGCTGHPSVVL